MTNLITTLTIATLLLAQGCGRFKKDIELQDPIQTSGDVHTLANKYCKLSKEIYDRNGYVHSKCDALLFTSLHGIGCDYVDINKFQTPAGDWKRSPTHDCFAKGESRSGVSRDMLIGLTLYALLKDRLDILEGLIRTGEANSWDMCGGEYESEAYRIGRCVVTANLKSTIYKAAQKLGYHCETRCENAIAIPQVWKVYSTGFEAHLTVLLILTRGLIDGKINKNQLDQLEYQEKRQPKNAFFSAVTQLFKEGNMSEPLKRLKALNFPAESLPNTASNFCDGYIWERDYGEDWLPCDKNKIHSGTDLIFLNKVMNGLK